MDAPDEDWDVEEVDEEEAAARMFRGGGAEAGALAVARQLFAEEALSANTCRSNWDRAARAPQLALSRQLPSIL